MYKNVIDPGKSVSFVLKDIDIGGQIQYLMCTGPLYLQTRNSYYAAYKFLHITILVSCCITIIKGKKC